MVLERRTEISTIDIIDRILDKGLVIDYEARISVLGVDICTSIDARVVVASIDTYIRYAPALRTPARLVDRLAEAEKRRQY